MARRRSSNRGLGCMLLGLAIVIGVGLWFYWSHRPALQRAWADLTGARAKSQRAAGAQFLTVEQLVRLKPAPGAPPMVRVEARLAGLRLENGGVQLELASLINPALRVSAEIPGSRAKSPLYDELREDVMLRFGPVTDQLTAPAQPTRVIVTGAVVRGAGGIELRPVTDLHVE